VALVTGEGRCPTLCVHHTNLPAGSTVVPGDELVKGLLRAETSGHQVQAVGSEGRVGVGLGGHRADTRPGTGHDGPHGEELGLDGDAPFL
jgi:hypothetical protein